MMQLLTHMIKNNTYLLHKNELSAENLQYCIDELAYGKQYAILNGFIIEYEEYQRAMSKLYPMHELNRRYLEASSYDVWEGVI
jgi:hypothetical protein